MTTLEDILEHKKSGSWRLLEAMAITMVNDASKVAGAEFQPVLGGGTRLMLALDHRISDDVDLFIRDPQWIGYLTPRLNDRFSDSMKDYDEGATSLKCRFEYGEVDFIVSMSLLGLPNERLPESQFLLEPVAEVLAKKLFYRGWALTARDLFDWYMIENVLPPAEVHAEALAELLKSRTVQIQQALQAMTKSEKSKAMWAGIRTHHQFDRSQVIEWAQQRLVDYEVLRLRQVSAGDDERYPVPAERN